jgi:hypothetical protein
MSSPKFERVKQLHPELVPLLERVRAYVRAQTAGGQAYIIPKLAAAALKLKDGESFVLLELLAQGGILRRVYNVYCRKQNVLLKTVYSLDDLDKIVQCDFCDAEHDPADFKAEIAFAPEENDLRDLAA